MDGQTAETFDDHFIFDLDFEHLLSAHTHLGAVFSPYDPIRTASVFGGLLTVPELQSNCARIESLVNLAVAFASGNKTPSKQAIEIWFAMLASGPCGLFEDPAEDAFTTNIMSKNGNYRVLEGCWESSGFYLQRIIEVIEGMPDEGAFEELKSSVFSLLKISDVICDNASLQRNEFGNPYPISQLPREAIGDINSLRKRVLFTDKDLDRLGISLGDLNPFIFDPSGRSTIVSSSLLQSPLNIQPLLYRSGQLVVAIPTAISIAIRFFAVKTAAILGLEHAFPKALAYEHRRYFEEKRLFGVPPGLPILFKHNTHSTVAGYCFEVDTGRYLQVIYSVDNLREFESTGLVGLASEPEQTSHEFEREIERCYQAVASKPGFREGITVIIGCGIGRPTYLAFDNHQRSNWGVVFLSAPDAITLHHCRHFNPLHLFRIEDAKRQAGRFGIELANLSGWLNIYAWAQSLGGHLVPHSEVPADYHGNKLRVILESNFVCDLRQEALIGLDEHVIQDWTGRWISIRKTNDSLFLEDRLQPLYCHDKSFSERGIPLVFKASNHHWWCEMAKPFVMQHWEILQCWIPRIARVLDTQVPDLPTGRLCLQVDFNSHKLNYDDRRIPTHDEIVRSMSIQVDEPSRSVHLDVGEEFQRGLRDSKNVSESALVECIVRGFLQLAGQSDDRAIEMCRLIIKDDSARSLHGFTAREFRDFLPDNSLDDLIKIDSIDDATQRLGLGWRVREKTDGSIIEEKNLCTQFLNDLVADLEDELTDSMQRYSKRNLVELALKNHEKGRIEQKLWRRTAGARLSLSEDKSEAMSVILEQEFERNAAVMCSRILVEIAICECQERGGIQAGILDLARLVAQVQLIVTLGGWSDAIHFGAMKPFIQITPLGDLVVDTSFFDGILAPFGASSTESMVNQSISDYQENYEPIDVSQTVDQVSQDFLDAWKIEKGFHVDDYRELRDTLEDLGIQNQSAIISIRKSELCKAINASEKAVDVLNSITFKPRETWNSLPLGTQRKEIFPWRMRREMSLLRSPIVQIDSSDDPMLLIAPGLVRDAFSYTLSGFYHGDFAHTQLKSTEMKAWFGHIAKQRGNDFTRQVNEKLSEIGWKTESDVKLQKILGRKLDKDFGDVDVLAWDESTSRVLLIECKNLHFHKTPGEVAEQLRDFRGELRNGKPDLLKKHLNRYDTLKQEHDSVTKYLGLTSPPLIEGWVCFQNPVPMLYAWEQGNFSIRFLTFDELHKL